MPPEARASTHATLTLHHFIFHYYHFRSRERNVRRQGSIDIYLRIRDIFRLFSLRPIPSCLRSMTIIYALFSGSATPCARSSLRRSMIWHLCRGNLVLVWAFTAAKDISGIAKRSAYQRASLSHTARAACSALKQRWIGAAIYEHSQHNIIIAMSSFSLDVAARRRHAHRLVPRYCSWPLFQILVSIPVPTILISQPAIPKATNDIWWFARGLFTSLERRLLFTQMHVHYRAAMIVDYRAWISGADNTTGDIEHIIFRLMPGQEVEGSWMYFHFSWKSLWASLIVWLIWRCRSSVRNADAATLFITADARIYAIKNNTDWLIRGCL